MDSLESAQTRRAIIKSALVVAGGMAVTACTTKTASVAARPMPLPVAPVPIPVKTVPASTARNITPQGIRPELFRKAIASLNRHSMRIPMHDRIAIADFAIPSYRPRFHIVNLGTGRVETLLVAHGIGSDPQHTGVLQNFSNAVGSEATCEGSFVTSDYYVGKHGMSQRLEGLDPTNNNALDRAIVIHSAWYSNPEMISKWGKLGRSQGCFAVGEQDLARLFERLGQGRMIYSAKV
ncbi:murein L,D-transpeptidase catalytic domain family protein [Sphingomonas sp. AOB5]|nr:murein L,D-transpeptidase catalytic domain family protein [Sphingomonas sp. AOB5]MDF7775649.1 murein L,D-transpeptidase catalytic domain family protein [Sphingomonas sp. AOB5]